MTTHTKNWQKITTTHGLILLALLAAYFLIMRFAGLGHVYWLRTVNLVFVYFILSSAVKAYRKRSNASYYEDFSDYFRVVSRTALIGIGLFSVFLAIYLDQIDTVFMEEITSEESMGSYLSPVTSAALIFIEGMVSALVCGYIIVQIMKSRTVEKPLEEKQKLRKEARD